MSKETWGDIVLEGYGEHALLRIDREAKRNAMNRAARAGMMKALDFAAGRFKAVVLTGSGTVFCAGIDLKERKEDVEKNIHTAPQEWTDVNVAIRQHPSVFIAAVNGAALGGGSTLINVCDLAVASETAEMGMPEMSFGSYPGLAGPSTQLSLSRKRVAWMVLTAERVPARQALEWGLVNQVVAPDQLVPTALAIAEKVARYDGIALAASKRALDRIPLTVTDWRQAFEFGDMVNADIRGKRSGNPFENALGKPA